MRKKKHSCDAGEAFRDVSAESRVLRILTACMHFFYCFASRRNWRLLTVSDSHDKSKQTINGVTPKAQLRKSMANLTIKEMSLGSNISKADEILHHGIMATSSVKQAT